MNPTIAALMAGITLGFSAGISPGPLLSLVLTTTLARGFAAGLRVAVAPLLTDALVVLICVLFLRAVPPWAQALLAAVGGLYVIYLGIESMRAARHATLATGDQPPARADLGRGALVNLLSPHPWLFWIAVGGPLLLGYWAQSGGVAAAFLFGFYALLVGVKVGIAATVARGRRYLNDAWFGRMLWLSGGLLLLFGLLLFAQALRVAR